MKTYARLRDGVVAEFVATAANIATLFNPAVPWADVTGMKDVQIGWVVSASGGFAPPAVAPTPSGAVVTGLQVADLQAQLAALQAQIVTLAAASAATKK